MKPILHKILIIILLMPLASTLVCGSQASVSPDHPVYDFLRRMETKGYLRDLALYSGPHSRNEVSGLLQQIYQHQKVEALSDYDEWYLIKYLAEFSDPRTGPLIAEEYYELHLLRYDYRNWTILGDLRSSLSNRMAPDREPDWQYDLGGEVRADFYRDEAGNSLGGYLRMITRAEPAEPGAEDHFDPEEGVPTIHRGGIANTNWVHTGIVWESDLGRFAVGHDRRWWGRGIIDGLQLGSSAPPSTYFRYVADLNRLRFTFLIGGLQTGFGQRSIAGHRLEWQPVRWLQLAISETVVYGDTSGTRGIELIYLNPLYPYTAAEPMAGNKDNNTSSIEAAVFPVPGVQVYFQWFLDDLTLTESFTEYYGNKWGLLAGTHLTDPMGLPTTDLALEYVRLEPWVYTHQNSVNRYQHFGGSLGYPLPPNSDRWMARIRKGLRPGWQITGEWQFTRHGAGDFTKSHKHPESQPYVPKKEFLQGEIGRSAMVGMKVEYEYFQHSYVSLRYEYRMEEPEQSYSLLGVGVSIDY